MGETCVDQYFAYIYIVLYINVYIYFILHGYVKQCKYITM